MRIKSINLTDYPPIGKFEVYDLGSSVVIAGANGSGKTRLKEAIVSTLQGSPVMDAVIVATRPEEEDEKYFNGHEVRVIKGQQNNILQNYMSSRTFGKGKYVGSLVQIDSTRSVENIRYNPVNWLGGDPDDSNTAWNFYFSAFQNRWQDFVNYIHQKTAARGKKISDAVLKDPEKTGEEWIDIYPDPLEKYKKIFQEALPGKKLLDINPGSPSEFRYRDQSGQELGFQTLSSGEKEIIKVLFDVARKDIRHSIVIIDEPELHLHPTLTFQLIESLKSLGDHTNQYIFLTHSSDLITTYFSSGDVYFIDPVNDGRNQAHRLLDLATEHHELVPLIGQNIGLFAVGKKIVFVEGEDSSIDRLAYQRIAQKVNGDIRVIPTGSVLNVMALSSIEEQIRNSIFGIDLFMIRDRDGLTDEQVASLEENSRIRCLKRRHIENYFLDPDILMAVAEKFYIPVKRPEVTKPYIEERLNQIAKGSIGYNLYKSINETISMNYFLKGPRIPNIGQYSVDEVKDGLSKNIEENLRELSNSLDHNEVAKWLDREEESLQAMIFDGSWVRGFNGKYIFQKICGDVLREDSIKVRHAYIDIALDKFPDRIAELSELFRGM